MDKEEKIDEEKLECENEIKYKHDWLGYLAAILGPISLISELIHINKKKSADDIGYFYLITYFIVILLWFSHSIINKVKPGMLSGGIGVFLMIIFFYLKIKYTGKK